MAQEQRTPICAGTRHAICEIADAGFEILFFLDAAVFGALQGLLFCPYTMA